MQQRGSPSQNQRGEKVEGTGPLGCCKVFVPTLIETAVIGIIHILTQHSFEHDTEKLFIPTFHPPSLH